MNEWKRLALMTAELTLRNTADQMAVLCREWLDAKTQEEKQDIAHRKSALEVSWYALNRDLRDVKSRLT